MRFFWKRFPFNGLYVLRRAICEYLYEYRGMRVSPDQIIIGAGTEYLYGKLLQLFGTQCVIAIEETGVQEIFGYLRQFRNSVGLYTDG